MINYRKAALREEIARRETVTVGVDLGALLATMNDKASRDQYANAWDQATGQGRYAG